MKDPATGVPIDCNDTVINVCYGYSQGAPGRLYDWRNPAVRKHLAALRHCAMGNLSTVCAWSPLRRDGHSEPMIIRSQSLAMQGKGLNFTVFTVIHPVL